MARTAIITGGAGGLGLAMARGLMADGHRVALIDSDGDAIARARDTLSARDALHGGEMLQPEVMAPPLRWLASDRSGATTGRRFVAALWDPDLPADEAAEKSGTPIGWPELAAATVVWPDD